MEHVQYYIWILNHYVGKNSIVNEEVNSDSEDIDYLETAIKCVELYQWLARHFDNNYFSFDIEALNHNKSMAIEKLNQLLSEKTSKKCSSCGAKVEDEHKFNICETCFSQRRSGGRGKPRYSKPRRGGSAAGNRSDGNKNFRRKPNDNKDASSSSGSQPKSGLTKSKNKKPKNKAAAFKKG
jgi:ATP-dependent RNA helicase SUPV3L1/SUV3